MKLSGLSPKTCETLEYQQLDTILAGQCIGLSVDLSVFVCRFGWLVSWLIWRVDGRVLGCFFLSLVVWSFGWLVGCLCLGLLVYFVVVFLPVVCLFVRSLVRSFHSLFLRLSRFPPCLKHKPTKPAWGYLAIGTG